MNEETIHIETELSEEELAELLPEGMLNELSNGKEENE